MPGPVSASYAYDAFGRRAIKIVEGTSTHYLYDGDRVIAEYDGSGTRLRRYVYGPGIDEPIRMTTASASYTYHFDAQGSVVALTDGGGALAESYTYTPFGETTGASALGNPYRYTGRRHDGETGLYYYRARHYSATSGRFLEVDPIGHAGGFNLYAYVHNNPLRWGDPMGLAAAGGGGQGSGFFDGLAGAGLQNVVVAGADFSGIQNFNPVKFGVGAVNTARGLTGLAAGTVTLGTSAGASTVVGPLALPGTAVGTAQLAFGAANVSRGTQQVHESFNDPAGPSFRNLLGVLPFGQEFDDPLEPLPQNFAAQRLRGLTTSPIETGRRLFYEFFAFGPNDSGAGP